MNKSITFVTGNINKLKELQEILSTQKNIQIKSKKINLPELQGDPIYIATEKAIFASINNPNDCPILIEDSALCFNALNGLPGPYIKDFEQKIGLDGLNNLLNAYSDKTAYAQCLFVLINKVGDDPIIFNGQCNGSIVLPQGNNGFGWDKIFKPNDYNITFAEMEDKLKNSISQRKIALDKLKEYLKTV